MVIDWVESKGNSAENSSVTISPAGIIPMVESGSVRTFTVPAFTWDRDTIKENAITNMRQDAIRFMCHPSI